MSKLGCICGHVIRDQTDSIPYKARFIRDQDDEAHSDYIEIVNTFIEAIKVNKRTQWITNYFSATYPTTLSDASVIADIISGYDLNFQSILYQCENCGRVKIQVQDKNLFSSFAPEDNDFQDIFKRFKE
jgi:hypothetical protein